MSNVVTNHPNKSSCRTTNNRSLECWHFRVHLRNTSNVLKLSDVGPFRYVALESESSLFMFLNNDKVCIVVTTTVSQIVRSELLLN